MTKRPTTWLSIILIVSITISSIFMLRTHQPNHTEKPEPSNYNAFMMDVSYTDFNDKGLLHSHSTSPKILRFEKNNLAFVDAPNITIYTNDGIRWDISAQHGESLEDGKKFFLWGNVKLHQPSQLSHPETTITTHEITFYPKTSFARTNKMATLIRPDATITGVGATADFKTGIFKLLSQSEGVYNANSVHQP